MSANTFRNSTILFGAWWLLGLLLFVNCVPPPLTVLDVDSYNSSRDTTSCPFSVNTTELTCIKLKGFIFDVDSIESFAKLLTNNRKITKLSFDECNVNRHFIRKLPLGELAQLKSVKIINSQLLNTHFDTDLLNLFPSSIEQLEVVIFGIQLKSTPKINLNFTKFTNLKELKLRHFKDSIDWSTSLKTIPYPEQIQVLDLTEGNVTRELESFFRRDGEYNLEQLHLACNSVPVEESIIQNCLRKCPRLASLDLSDNNLTDMTFLNELFVENSFTSLKRLALSQKYPMSFANENPLNWLTNLRLDSLSLEGEIFSKQELTIENAEFKELLISDCFSVSLSNCKNLTRLAISSDSLVKGKDCNLTQLQELKVFLFPDGSNYDKLFNTLSGLSNLTSLSIVWMENCDDELRGKIFSSLLSTLLRLTKVKAVSLRAKKDTKVDYPPTLLNPQKTQLEKVEIEIQNLSTLRDWEPQIDSLKNLTKLVLRFAIKPTTKEENEDEEEEDDYEEDEIFPQEEKESIVLYLRDSLTKLREFEVYSSEFVSVNLISVFRKMPALTHLTIDLPNFNFAVDEYDINTPSNIRFISINLESLLMNRISDSSVELVHILSNVVSVHVETAIEELLFDLEDIPVVLHCISLIDEYNKSHPCHEKFSPNIQHFPLLKELLPSIYVDAAIKGTKLKPVFQMDKDLLYALGTVSINPFGLRMEDFTAKVASCFIQNESFDVFEKFLYFYSAVYQVKYLQEERVFYVLRLICITKYLMNDSIGQIKTITEDQKNVLYYLKEAKQFLTSLPKNFVLDKQDVLVAQLVLATVDMMPEEKERTAEILIKDSNALDCSGISITEWTDFIEVTEKFFALVQQRDGVMLHNFVENYDPNSTFPISLFKVFSRYFGKNNKKFIDAVVSDSSTAKDKEFLKLIFGFDENVERFVEKLKHLHKLIRDNNENEEILAFEVNPLTAKSAEDLTKKYSKFLEEESVLKECLVCHKKDHEMNLETATWNHWVLQCSHRFHKSCARRGMRSNTKKCPVCKTEMKHQPPPKKSGKGCCDTRYYFDSFDCNGIVDFKRLSKNLVAVISTIAVVWFFG